MSGKINEMSNETAYLIRRCVAEETDPEKLKAAITRELDTMLSNGEISQKDYKAAVKITNDNSIMNALITRHEVESTINFWGRYHDEDGNLDSATPEVNNLMKVVKLDPNDIYEITKPIVKGDYTANDKDLGKIQKLLNKKIKENGVDYKLSKDEAKLLLESLGFNIKEIKPLQKILLRIPNLLGATGDLGGIISGFDGIKEEKIIRTLDQIDTKVTLALIEKSGGSEEFSIDNNVLKDAIKKYEEAGARVEILEQNETHTVIKIEV